MGGVGDDTSDASVSHLCERIGRGWWWVGDDASDASVSCLCERNGGGW